MSTTRKFLQSVTLEVDAATGAILVTNVAGGTMSRKFIGAVQVAIDDASGALLVSGAGGGSGYSGVRTVPNTDTAILPSDKYALLFLSSGCNLSMPTTGFALGDWIDIVATSQNEDCSLSAVTGFVVPNTPPNPSYSQPATIGNTAGNTTTRFFYIGAGVWRLSAWTWSDNS